MLRICYNYPKIIIVNTFWIKFSYDILICVQKNLNRNEHDIFNNQYHNIGGDEQGDVVSNGHMLIPKGTISSLLFWIYNCNLIVPNFIILVYSIQSKTNTMSHILLKMFKQLMLLKSLISTNYEWDTINIHVGISLNKKIKSL